MNISINYNIYHEHKVYFDEMAISMKKAGHRIGFVSNLREIHPVTKANKRDEILKDSGFTPDFICLWGETETIANGNLWLAQKLDQENVTVHHDEDATEIKKYTNRWILKVLNSGAPNKF